LVMLNEDMSPEQVLSLIETIRLGGS
jgi:hypothetical protein